MTQHLLVRICGAAILALAFAFTIEAQTKSQSWLRGTWEGTGYQIDDQIIWPMRFIARGRRFSIEYPSLSCGGSWKLIYVNATEARFKERLTHGKETCTDNGNVTIRRLSNKQIVYLFSNSGTHDISASSILTKNRKQ
jgi:hypothetical protein